MKPAQAEALLEAIGAALDGRRLTREAMAHEIGRRAGSWAHEWLVSTRGSLLGPAAYTGRLCFGPSQGSKVTLVRAEYAIMDVQTGHFSLAFHRVPFDVAALIAIYQKCGRPHASTAIAQYVGR